MFQIHPMRWMVTGGVLLFVGFIGPLLMVVRVVEPTFLLAFASFAASTAGFFVGMIGLFGYTIARRPPSDPFR
ncbi:MAG: hypothetical protein RML36_14750 [Anaerolineae bacterium]|nr:hypothetical protein [Anaerolineae bacterium]MDW8100730.1 hypothetical protein [Anaerolineae bacterium]